MITYSIIKKSELEGAVRLDAEYYQPEYLEVGKKLQNSAVLSDISKKITDFGAYSQMNFVEFVDKGIRFLRNQDIGEFFINDSDPVFVSDDTYKKLSLKLEEFDILTPRVGTLGNATVVFNTNLPATANQNLAQIKADLNKIDPVFLAIFLCSNYGRKQFERAATGNVQPWLNLMQIKNLKVFVPKKKLQEEIRDLALEALKVSKGSIEFYKQAEELLLEELGLSSFAKAIEDEKDLWWVVDLSDVKSAKRIDADYFQPKYQKLVEQIQKNNSRSLGDLVLIKKGFEPGSEAYQEEGKLFIRVSSVSKLGIEEKDQKYLSEELYKELKKDYEPKLGDILLTKDATPGIAYVIKEPIEGIISGGILDLKVKENIESEYLALCISSIVGQWQAQRDSGGSVIAHWKPKQIKNLLIPILPKQTQQKIAELVRKSHEARNKSKELLEEAKRKVEEMIDSTSSLQVEKGNN